MGETTPVEEFQALTSLLHIVQTINSSNQPRRENNQDHCSGYRDDDSDMTMMDAIASILVQRHEANVVAASFQGLDKVSVVVATTNPTTPDIGELHPGSEVGLDIDSTLDK